MRTSRKNTQIMFYSNLIGTVPVYEKDEYGNVNYYEDNEGNRYPIESGQKEMFYETPQEFLGNISLSGGEARAVEYGLSTEAYQAVMVLPKGSIPLKEGSLIWHTSPVEYEYNGLEVEVEIDGKKMKTTAPKAVSSDYIVLKSSPSLDVDKFVLKATNK